MAGMPTITISTVAGVSAPAAPTGNADITLPESTPNPVTVDFTSSEVPIGNTIELTVIPAHGDSAMSSSTAIAGTQAAGTATATIDIPDGPSVLQASVSYTVPLASLESEIYSRFAGGEPVKEVTVATALNGGSTTTFTTISGKEFTWPSDAVAMN